MKYSSDLNVVNVCQQIFKKANKMFTEKNVVVKNEKQSKEQKNETSSKVMNDKVVFFGASCDAVSLTNINFLSTKNS